VPNRTSPVVRGAWIVENLLGARVPSPPPGVETDLDKSQPGANGSDTLRQRLEAHRADPACASCHSIMDPFGFSLENFDLVGRWRSVDNGVPLNTASEMVDGTYVDAFMTALGERLLTYALGRELEYYDGPAVRHIVQTANADGFTLTALVQAVVASVPFQQRMKLDTTPAAE
jgi:hypothetical protein